MSTPAKALNSSIQRNVLIVSEDQRQAFESRFWQSIQQRAYQLFEQGGRIHGQDRTHWLQAEKELLQYAPPPREAGAWSTANASLQNVDPQNVQVLVLQDRIMVSLAHPAERPAYLLIRWPIRVDPATAAAYLKGDTLVVTAKHLATTGGAPDRSATAVTVAPTNPDRDTQARND